MIKQFIDYLIRKYFLHKNEELPAFLLQKLFHQGEYLPFTGSSLKIRLMACMANDIVINSKKSILEFGYGISTIIFARLIKLNNLNATIVSIDESQEWISVLKNILKKEGLEHIVTFIYCPTVKSNELLKCFEYDSTILSEQLSKVTFDSVLIDGPIAWSSYKRMSRVANIKFFINNLSENFTIFVDDTNRKGEKILVKELKKQLNINPTILDSTFVSFSKGTIFSYAI